MLASKITSFDDADDYDDDNVTHPDYASGISNRVERHFSNVYKKDEDDDEEGDGINRDDNRVHASLASQIG